MLFSPGLDITITLLLEIVNDCPFVTLKIPLLEERYKTGFVAEFRFANAVWRSPSLVHDFVFEMPGGFK